MTTLASETPSNEPEPKQHLEGGEKMFSIQTQQISAN